jgi:hypothetical protein
MDYTHYDIPANFTDNGKLLGMFEIRNAIEAVILLLPLLYLGFTLFPGNTTLRIIAGLTLAVPVGGFALIGVGGDCLTRFARVWWTWLRHRKNLLYRGDANEC